MKKVFVISIIFLTFSCSVKKDSKDDFETITTTVMEKDVTKTESDIINDFLAIEFGKERYKPYKNY